MGATKLSPHQLKEFFKTEKGLDFSLSPKTQERSGLATHCKELDQFLFWGGLPTSAVSLFYGQAGLGGTRLWLQTAQPLLQNHQWVAWMNGPETELTPWHFQQKKVDLSRLILISAPKTSKEWFWALEETLSLSLFDLIGFSLDPWNLKDSQLLKLHQLTRHYQTCLVLLSQRPQVPTSPFYSVILNFTAQKLRVERTRHRPTPKEFTRRTLYADFMPQLAKGRQALRG